MAQAEEGEKPYRDIYLFNMLDPAVPPVIPREYNSTCIYTPNHIVF